MKAITFLMILLLVACSDDSSSNITLGDDAGSMDAGVNSGTDAGTADMSLSDMGPPDSGALDMSLPDSGPVDMAGESDAGTDAGDMGTSGCSPYAAVNSCEAGESCRPDRIDASDELVGVCEPTGPIQNGESCDPAAPSLRCDSGFVCVASCKAHCDPRAQSGQPGACATGERCAEVQSVNGALDWGVCETTCDPYTPGSCGPGLMCFPQDRDQATGDLWGTCVAEGFAQAGEACGTIACVEGLVCSAGVCEQHCDVQAMAGDPGACGANEGCTSLVDMSGTPFEFGVCIGSCEYAHGDPANPTTPCVDSSTACYPAEFLGTPFDVCTTPPVQTLNPGDDCTAAGLGAFENCAVNAICVDGNGQTTCTELCFATEGALGTTNHPDCSESTQTCADVLNLPGIGACR